MEEFLKAGSGPHPPLTDNQRLVWTPDDVSVEERRATLEKYQRKAGG